MMGVIYAQPMQKRVVSKHGCFNTFVRPDKKEEQHRFVLYSFIKETKFPLSEKISLYQ